MWSNAFSTGTFLARLEMTSANSASPSKMVAGASGSTITSPSPMMAEGDFWKAFGSGFSGSVPFSM